MGASTATDDERTVRGGSWRDWASPGERPLRLGVSTCLLGEPVRYDGGHAFEPWLRDGLGRYAEWVSVCPEAEVGMGIPRPPVRLVRVGDDERMIDPKRGIDHTDAVRSFARERVDALRDGDLDGYVLKRGSPSCGLERLRVHTANGQAHKNGVGLFARTLLERWPDLPLEEEGRLNDPHLRIAFLERIFARNRWRRFVAEGPSRAGLVAFHTAHKFQLLAHDETVYRELGRVVSSFGAEPDTEVHARYGAGFLAVLARPSTVRRHVNVLQHLLGFFKDAIESVEKRQVLAAIEDFRAGLVPIVVPATLLRHLVERHDEPYLAGQLYLDPFPRELALRGSAGRVRDADRRPRARRGPAEG